MLTTTEQSRTGKRAAAPGDHPGGVSARVTDHSSRYAEANIRAVSRSGSRADSAGRSRSGLAVTLRYARWLRLTCEIRRSALILWPS
jgi:hypothetical protein